jgi:trimeric autotransporter adhesin
MAFFKGNKHRKWLILTTILIVSLLGGFIYVKYALAYSCVWTGASGINLNWSNSANWTSCNSNYPQSGDSVTFNSTSNAVIVDAGWGGTISQVSISSGFGGSITMARSMTVSGSFTQGAGTFSAAGQTLTVTGAFSLTAGSFTASSGTTTFSSGFTISGSPTFTANGGTVTFQPITNNYTYACNSAVFNLVTINLTNASGYTTTVNADCSFPLGAGPTIIDTNNGGNTPLINLKGVFSGTGTLTITTSNASYASLTLDGASASLSGFTGLAMKSSATLTLSNNANFDATNYNPFSTSISLTINSGSAFTAPSAGASFNSFTNNGTINGSSGSVSFNGVTATQNGTINASSGSFSFTNGLTNNGTFNGSSGTITVSGNFTNNADKTFTASSTTTTFSGNFTNSGTFNANGGTAIFNSASSQAIAGATTFSNLTVTGTSSKTITFPASTTITVSNTLILKGTSSGSKMLVRSSSDGTQALIAANGPNDLEWINVKDSNACSGHSLVANVSTNSNNNSCWTFISNGPKNPTYIQAGVKINAGTKINGT